MITQAESGLTTEQYAAFEAATTGGRYSVTAYKYNPTFSVLHSAVITTIEQFDACLHAGTIVTFIPALLKVKIFTIATGITQEYSVTPPVGAGDCVSLASAGGLLYAFWGCADGVYLATHATGAAFSGWTKIVSGLNPLVTAVSSTEIFIADGTGDNQYHLKRAAYVSSAWVLSNSHVYLSRRPNSISAANNGQTTAVALSVIRPGLMTSRYVGNVVVKQVKRSEGIISFLHKDGLWSDRVDIDVLDNATDWRYRRYVKLTAFHGTFYLTAHSADSLQVEYSNMSIRLYTSKDGVYWSMGSIMHGLSNYAGVGNVRLFQSGTTLYAAQTANILSAPSTMQFGVSDPSQALDLTPHILEYTSSATEGRQSALALSNEDDYLNTTFLTSEQSVIMLVHRWGYDEIGDVQTIIEEVDAVNESITNDAYIIQLVSRDRVAWLSDRSQSENFAYRQSQLWGGDKFHDTTGSNAGGLAHTSTITGVWKTRNGELYSFKKNEECVAFSTFDPDMIEGEMSVAFTLSTLGNDEYAGIVFWAHDVQNMWHFTYRQNTDQVILYERRQGVDTIRASYSSIGWADDLDQHWLKVIFMNGVVTGLTSDDGYTWLSRLTHNPNGYALEDDESSEAFNLPLERGYTGYIAKGYSPEEEFDDEWGDYIDIPQDWSPPGEIGIDDKKWVVKVDDPAPVPVQGCIVITTNDLGKVHLCKNFYKADLTSADYIDITPTTLPYNDAKFTQAIFDTRRPYSKAAYALWVSESANCSGVCYTANVFAKKVIWRWGAPKIGKYHLIRLVEAPSGIYMYSSEAQIESVSQKVFDFEAMSMSDQHPDRAFIEFLFKTNDSNDQVQCGAYFAKPFNKVLSGKAAFGGVSRNIIWLRYDLGEPRAIKEVSVDYTVTSSYNGIFTVNGQSYPSPHTNGRSTVTVTLNGEYDYVELYIQYDELSAAQYTELYKMTVTFNAIGSDPSGEGAAIVFSKNNGQTWGNVNHIGPGTPTLLGGDTPRKGRGAYFGSINRINRTRAYNGRFETLIQKDTNYVSIAVPWLRIGHIRATNFGESPDFYAAVNSRVDGHGLFKVIKGVATGITPPTPVDLVGFGPNAIMSWGGKIIYVCMSGTGGKQIFKSIDAGSTWMNIGTLDIDSTGYIRTHRFVGTAKRLFVANDDTIKYSPDGGGTWIEKAHPSKVLSVEVYG